MYMIELTEDKLSGLYEDVEKGLRYIGKAMQCLDELKESDERDRKGYRDDDREMRMGERTFMRGGSGRYSRY